ncbi:MAG: restriction endonuclease subunit S [Nitrososphaerota archaeon]
MNKIEFYKETNFKQTQLGKMPTDWDIIRFGENFVEIEIGKRAKGGALTEGTVASIGGEHIDDRGNILWSDMKFIPEDFYESLNQGKVKLGDILLVKDGATTGKVALLRELHYEKVAVNEHVFVIRSKVDRLLNEFLYYFLFSKFGQIQIKTRFHGLIGGIVREDLEKVLIPYPPVVEQRAIAEVLSVVDLAIQRTDMVIAKTERLKKGLMQELLTRGIGHKEFKDTEIGRIPKDWEVVRLKDISEQRKEIVLPEEVNPLTPYIGLEHISSGVTKIKNFGKAGDVKSSKFKFFKNDILYGKLRPYLDKAVIAEVNGVCSTDIIIIKAVKCIPSFLIYLLHTKDFINYATATMTGTNHPRTSWPAISKFNLPLPPTEEQQKIAEILLTVDKKLEIERNEKARLEIIKQGLMDLLLTGKVRVRVN